MSTTPDVNDLKKAAENIFGGDGGAARTALEIALEGAAAALGGAVADGVLSEEESKVARNHVDVISSLHSVDDSVPVAETPSDVTPAEERASRLSRRAAASVERADELTDIHNACSTTLSGKPRKQTDNVDENIDRAIRINPRYSSSFLPKKDLVALTFSPVSSRILRTVARASLCSSHDPLVIIRTSFR